MPGGGGPGGGGVPAGGNCLKCHTGKEYHANRVACTDSSCHPGAHRTIIWNGCKNCHAERQHPGSTYCWTSCHSDVPQHRASPAKLSYRVCLACHRAQAGGGDCLRCHKGAIHTSSPTVPTNCRDCHAISLHAGKVQCTSCHVVVSHHGGTNTIKKCADCHTAQASAGDCTKCHPAAHHSANPQTGNCDKCHSQRKHLNKVECVKCHLKTPHHGTQNVVAECSACHSQQQHASKGCKECHTPIHGLTVVPSSSICSNCHKVGHTIFGDCLQCHRTAVHATSPYLPTAQMRERVRGGVAEAAEAAEAPEGEEGRVKAPSLEEEGPKGPSTAVLSETIKKKISEAKDIISRNGRALVSLLSILLLVLIALLILARRGIFAKLRGQ